MLQEWMLLSNKPRGNAMRVLGISFLLLSSLVLGSEAVVSSAPDSNLDLTVSAIRSAKKKLSINIYEMTSQDIADAIVNAIRNGVSVDILQEGQPVGGISQDGLDIQDEILEAMEESGGLHHYFEMSGERKDRRFAYDHAKYIVVDNQKLLIGSENYSPSGQPKNGNKGNRGWEVFLNDNAVVKKYNDIFQSDIRTEFNDVFELENRNRGFQSVFKLAGPGWVTRPSSRFVPPMDVRGQQLAVDSSLVVTSPDTSMSGIINFIKDSKKTLEIQQMTFALEWNGQNAPTVKEVVAAARRGVKVRVLLNDEKAFGSSAKQKNLETVEYLNTIAENEGLDMEGRIANLKEMGVKIIHNKGALADGSKTLISSINWNQNSIKNNREAAVVIESTSVNKNYLNLFNQDWLVSERLKRIKH